MKGTDQNKDTVKDIRLKIWKERNLCAKPEKFGSARYWKTSIREKRVDKNSKRKDCGRKKKLELFIHWPYRRELTLEIKEGYLPAITSFQTNVLSLLFICSLHSSCLMNFSKLGLPLPLLSEMVNCKYKQLSNLHESYIIIRIFSLKIVKTKWNILHAESKYGINNEGNREYIQH